MLDTKKPIVREERPTQQDIASPAALLASFVGFLRRRAVILVVTFCFALGLGAVYLFTTPPNYTAHSVLMIDTRKVQLFQQQSVLGDIGLDSATVESQVELLKSEKIAGSVVKELHLTDEPDFVSPTPSLFSSVIRAATSIFAASTPEGETDLRRAAVEQVVDGLTVKRVGLTYVIDIGFKARSRERAAQIANAIAEAYVVDQLEAKYQATRRASAWLQDRIRELREQASTAERAVVQFRTENDIVDTGGRSMDEQMLAELNSQLSVARAATAEAKARLERIEDIIRSGMPDATVTDTLRSEVITKLRTLYLELQRREADWSAKYGATHLATINLRNQMREINRSILEELRRLSETYKSDYEIAKAREDAVNRTLADVISQSQTTNQKRIALRDLQSTAETYRALHDNFLQKYMESVQQQSFPITEARVITEATPPVRKSDPKGLIVLAIATAAGLVFGFGFGTLRDLSDRRFRFGGQVETELQTSCLGVLPAVNAGKPGTTLDAEIPKVSGGAERQIQRISGPAWTVLDSPFSRFAEGIRGIKVAADLRRLGNRDHKVIAITSSLPNEGKSTIAASLALQSAHSGSKVILIDCDLRNSALSRHLSPNAEAGLLDVVAGEVSLEDAIWSEPTTTLAFLPGATHSRLLHSAEILSSDATQSLFDRLRTEYDYVILDMSPLAPVVDVRAAAHLADSFVFVVEWGRTQIEVAAQALESAPGLYDKLLGAVLNKAELRVLRRHEGYSGSYYYKRYYARYGYTD